MEYIYTALLLHSAGKEITEENIAKVLKAAGLDVDMARIKALTASLAEVNIDEAISKPLTVAPTVAAPSSAGDEEKLEEKKKEEKEEEEEEVSEEEAAAGLGALFG